MFRKHVSAALILTLIFIAPAAAAAVHQQPIRILLISDQSQIFPQVKAIFDKRFGDGLISLRIVPSDDASVKDLQNADVVFTYYLRVDVLQRLSPAIPQTQRRGVQILSVPPDVSETEWRVQLDRSLSSQASAYWQYGEANNMLAFLAFLYRVGGGPRHLEITAPQPQPSSGIYHPRTEQIFSSLQSYLAWYRTQRIVS